ncbi:hypothetical protein HII31_07094 [Pseudocercospora fuligena]|uniref:Uncharacterized protein n=1 Tax=Pseudocercospora fuligena TaxID=685502 RepID=A0A8H6VID7_9PEZI|nr:hypothetical protein HII31_07094 [Pseudocercospora fuligena]
MMFPICDESSKCSHGASQHILLRLGILRINNPSSTRLGITMQLSTIFSAILAAAVSVNAAYPPTRVQAERLGLLEERQNDCSTVCPDNNRYACSCEVGYLVCGSYGKVPCESAVAVSPRQMEAMEEYKLH